MVYFYLFCFIPDIITYYFGFLMFYLALCFYVESFQNPLVCFFVTHLHNLSNTCYHIACKRFMAGTSYVSPISIFAYKVSSQTSINNQSILVVELTTPTYCTKSSDNNFLEIQSFDFLILFTGLQFSLFSLWHLSVKFCFLWYIARKSLLHLLDSYIPIAVGLYCYRVGFFFHVIVSWQPQYPCDVFDCITSSSHCLASFYNAIYQSYVSFLACFVNRIVAYYPKRLYSIACIQYATRFAYFHKL